MNAVPTKLTPRLISEMDSFIDAGWYASRSEFLREAARQMIEEKKKLLLEEAIAEDIKWGLKRK